MDAKNILAVDTSSRVLSIAISATLRGGSATHSGGRTSNKVLFEANLEGTPRHSEQLISVIEEGLDHVGLKKNELDEFVWGLGPGSFTGLRIGLSILKGFHLGFRKKAFGASSLDLIAFGSGMVSGELIVCIDARRERIYTAIYRFRNGEAQKVLPDCVISFDRLAKKIKPGAILTGDALVPYGDLIREKFGEKALFLKPSFWYPRARFLIHLYETKRQWLKPLTLKTMVPQYLRISEAEEKFGSPR